MTRPAYPPLEVDDLDARLDARAAARGIPSLRTADVTPTIVLLDADHVVPTAPKHSAVQEGAGQRRAVETTDSIPSSPSRQTRKRTAKRSAPAPTPNAPTPRSRMKSLNVELPDYVWVELKSRAAREMVSVRHVIMTLLDEAGIEIAAVDLVEDGRRLRATSSNVTP